MVLSQAYLEDLKTPFRDPTRQRYVTEPYSSHMYRSVNILTNESGQFPRNFRRPKFHHGTPPSATMLNPASYQHVHQTTPYGHQLHDPVHPTRTQQQSYLPHFNVSQAAQYQVGARLRSLHEQTEPPRALMYHHAYSVNQSGFSVVDMRSSLHQFPMGYDAPGSHADLGKIRLSRVARVLR